MSWCPIFPQITASSVWSLPPHIFKAWIAILTHKDHESHVWRGNPHTLAKLASITLDQSKEAVSVLSSPDEGSLSREQDGKRIVSDDGEHWFVVNGEKYQEMIKREIAKENARQRTAKWRAGKRVDTLDSTPETLENPVRSTRFVAPTIDEVRLEMAKQGLPESKAEEFIAHYEKMDWCIKGQKIKRWRACVTTWRIKWENEGRPGLNGVSDPDSPPPKSDWKAYEAWALKQIHR